MFLSDIQKDYRLFCGSLMQIEINCHVRTHESDSEVTVRRLGKMIQKNFFAQLEARVLNLSRNSL